VTAFHGAGDTLVFTAEAPHRPGEPFARHGDGREVRLSSFNERLCEACEFVAASSPVTIESAGGELTYWRLDPAEPRSDGAIVMQVHGGPAANYGYGFTFEFQFLAAAGYTVVYGNPRGGSSFGRAFATAIQGRYGTIDADDVMAMVEHAVARHPTPDAPVHLTGGSYGGFMTNWLIGRTHRFRSAVTQRSISNFASFYGTSDIGPWFTEREIGSAPWRDLSKLWDQSPLKHVAEIRTPLLILHSEQDHRCPIEQAEQLYAALVRVGEVPTEFVRFPDEGHELSRSGRPDRRIARLEAILDWFSRHA
jgi:dipeptidyl aminopeptidase/acylaminoacyl peptidase